MSKYHWETDYGDEPEVTLGDGGDVEEVSSHFNFKASFALPKLVKRYDIKTFN